MKNRRISMSHLVSMASMFALLLVLTACSKKEEDRIDPDNPGLAVAGNYTINYYNANGVEYDPAKVGAIGMLSVVPEGKEYIVVEQVLALKNTTIFNPFPKSMKIVKSGDKSVLLQTSDGMPIGSIDNGNMDIKLVDPVYTTIVRAKRL